MNLVRFVTDGTNVRFAVWPHQISKVEELVGCEGASIVYYTTAPDSHHRVVVVGSYASILNKIEDAAYVPAPRHWKTGL